MQLTLFYNENAGSGEYSRSELLELLKDAGHQVSVFSVRPEELKKALKEEADLLVIAGGDGAVSKVIDRASAKGPPLAILPLGIANNIATSLGIVGEPRELIESWEPLTLRPFYRLNAKGPWGRRRIVEGIGFGAFEQAMDEMGSHKPDIESAREWLADTILHTPPERLVVGLDSEALAEEFALLEITNIPFVGPRIHLAPFADPSNPLMNVSYLGTRRADRREFARWLKHGAPKDAVPVKTRAVRRAVVAGDLWRVRLNDKNWSPETENSKELFDAVVIEAGTKPLRFAVPRRSKKDE
jgi:diacylglycerol kinase (ATP)